MMNWTYLMECKKTGIIKIGKSKDPNKRLSSIKTGNPFVELIGVTNVGEKVLHKEYKEYNIGLEWFEIDDKIVKDKLFKLFKPISSVTILKDDYSEIIKKCIELDKNFSVDDVRRFSGEIYKKLGASKFRKLLKNCDEFRNLIHKEMYMSL